MSLHEIAALRDAAHRMYESGKLLTTGEAFTAGCWAVLIVFCVLREAAEALLG
jgi:hypothetical protein